MRPSPQSVYEAAGRVLAWDWPPGEGKGPRAFRAKEAVAGALRALAGASFEEIAGLMGYRHHSVVYEQVKRYNRDWPGSIRELWESAVFLQLGIERNGGASPGARRALARIRVGKPLTNSTP